MPTLDFDAEYFYGQSGNEGILLSVELRTRNAIRLQAHVDTGAANCLFRSDYADLLGLTLTDRVPRHFSPAGGGRITAYGHEVTMTVLEHTVDSLVFFTDHPGFTRNVLGRQGWLHHFKFGLVHYESKLYLGAI